MGCCNSKVDPNISAVEAIVPDQQAKHEDKSDINSTVKKISKPNDEKNTHKQLNMFNSDYIKTKIVLDWMSKIQGLLDNTALCEYALAKKRTDFTSLKQLAVYFKKCPHAKNKTELAWCIYYWIAHNIMYDDEGFKRGEFNYVTPDSVFQSGITLCGGYSSLFEFLCTFNEIDCIKMSGFSKAVGYVPGQSFSGKKYDHAWNAIKLDEKWHYVEVTWASPTTTDPDRVFSPYYFIRPPHLVFQDHYTEQYIDVLGDAAPNLTLAEFEANKEYKSNFHLFFLNCMTHHNIQKIELKITPLFIEYRSHKKLRFLVELKDTMNDKIIEDSSLIQYDFESDKYMNKYGIYVFLKPELNIRNQKLELKIYAQEFLDKSITYSLVDNFEIVTTGSVNLGLFNNPKSNYKLSFPKLTHNLECVLHSTQFIVVDSTEPVVLKFKSSNKDLQLHAQLNYFDKETETIENAIFIQSLSGLFHINVVLPELNKLFNLSLWERTSNDGGKSYSISKFANFIMIRTKGETLFGRERLLCEKFNICQNFYLENPIQLLLNKNQPYEFRVRFQNKPKSVALIDKNENFAYLHHNEEVIAEPNRICNTEKDGYLFWLKRSYYEIGKLKISADFGEGYYSICSYEVV
jgi:hypothetical protein